MREWHSAAKYLIETVADSLNGFDHIASQPDRFSFHAFCEPHILERQELLRAMRVAMHAHGLDHDPQGTLLGAAHRLFIDLRSAIQGGENAVIAEMLRGEEFLASRAYRFNNIWRLPRELKSIGGALQGNIGRSIGELRTLVDASRPPRMARMASPAI